MKSATAAAATAMVKLIAIINSMVTVWGE